MSDRSKLDWYKRNPAKFIGGTVGMPFELKGAYSILLDLIYDGGGSCQDDPRWIASMLGIEMTVRRWNIIRSKLIDLGKLVVREDRLFNPAASRMMDRERGDQNELQTGSRPVPEPVLRQNKSEFIDRKKHPQNRTTLFEDKDLTPTTRRQTKTFPARARESQNQNQIKNDESSITKTIVEVEQIAKALGQERGRYWERDYARMIEDGLTFEAILEAAKAHRGDPLKGIYALKGLAWHKQRNGVKSEPSSPAQSVTLTDRQWEENLARLLRIGAWVASDLGPPPTREGHLVPAHLWARWDKLWRAQGSHPVQEIDYSADLVPYPAETPSPLFRSFWEPQA